MSNSREWTRCDLPREIAEKFKEYLRDMHIKFEPSENGNDIHFECFMNDEECAKGNDFIGGIKL